MPKYTRNTGKEWTKDDLRQLKELAKENTQTRIIGLKLGRTEGSVRKEAANEKVSRKPVNKSPYNRELNGTADHRKATIGSSF